MTLRFGRAWVAMTVALAAHVADEALTDFLGVYNPLVLAARERVAWFPMPTFTFDVWISGLVFLIAILFGLSPLAYRGVWLTRLLAYPFAIIIGLLNGAGHLAGSVYFGRWMPGATTAPLLIACDVWLLLAARASDHGRANAR